MLQVVPASQSQCRQRTGRAGRDAPGKCFRLFPEAAFAELPAATVPEIQRSNLAAVVLQLKAIGVDDVLNFDFMDPPPREALKNALSSLYALEAMVRS
jgi:HrpA-like RNA helicase